MILKAIAKSKGNVFFKSENGRHSLILQVATKKRSKEKIKNPAKKIKSDNFTMSIQKNPILLLHN